jgi:signal transduction histidine kinase/ligand-binding sensor domain-containing protein
VSCLSNIRYISSTFHLLFIGMCWVVNTGICTLSAQSINFTHLNDHYRLPDIAFTALAQDNAGYIWAGTVSGLYHLDALQSRFFGIGSDSLSIPGGFVQDIEVSRNGEVWISCRGGIAVYNPDHGYFHRIPITGTNQDNITHIIHDILEDQQGNIWIASDNRDLFKFDSKKQAFQRCGWNSFVKENRYSDKSYLNIYGLLEKNPTEIWLFTNIGLYSFNKNSQQFQYYADPVKDASKDFNDAWDDGKGKLWINRGGTELYCFDYLKNNWQSWDLVPDEVTANDRHPHWKVVPFGRDQLLVGTVAGLMVFDLVSGSFHLERHNAGRLISAPNGWINSLLKDDQGAIWIAGENGISKIEDNKQAFQFHFFKALEGKVVTGIGQDSAHSIRLLTTFPSGPLWIEQLNNNLLKSYPIPRFQQLIQSKQIWEESGRCWMIDFNGLWSFDQHKIQFVSLESVGPKLFETPYKGGIPDGQGHVFLQKWAGGLSVFDIHTHQIRDLTIKKEEINCAAYDIQRNLLYCGTNGNGLWVYDTKLDSIIHIFIHLQDKNHTDLGLFRDCSLAPDGKLWMLTDPARLVVYDPEAPIDSQIKPYYTVGDISTSLFQSVTVSKQGIVWLSGETGVCRFDPRTGKAYMFGKEYGLSYRNFPRKIFILPDGTYAIGVSGGYATWKDVALIRSLPPPRVVLTGFSINGERESDIITLQKEGITLPYYRNHLNFTFTTLQYLLPEEQQFVYRLDGSLDSWTTTQANNITFNKLSPGEYIFRLKAGYKNGIWSNDEVAINIKIKPHFTQTSWFVAVLIALFAAIFFGLYRFRVHQLQQVQRVRSRIAGDLHDDVASTISSIAFYSDFAQKEMDKGSSYRLKSVLEKISLNAREALDSMRDIVWAINSEYRDFESVLKRMKDSGNAVCQARQVNFRFDASSLQGGLFVPLDTRHHLLLIFKECLNNAMKYAECREVAVLMENKDHFLHFTCTDDGRGFNPEDISGGNGLANMKKRAKDCGGNFEIQTSPGEGTCIKVSFRLK